MKQLNIAAGCELFLPRHTVESSSHLLGDDDDDDDHDDDDDGIYLFMTRMKMTHMYTVESSSHLGND